MVRSKGTAYLAKNPGTRDLRPFWRDCLTNLWEAYDGICAYSCFHIPGVIGGATVDHFLPKSSHPALAYEWTNYRLASQKLNARKQDFEDVLDPFCLAPNSFVLTFPAMLVVPGDGLTVTEEESVSKTIERLQLNRDEMMVDYRLQWVLDYCLGHISFEFLLRCAPFVGYEINRQGLRGRLAGMFLRYPVHIH